ncbi:hypothetical protein FA95DRAFT_1497982 [Auriscalpium vulgare]|uniref:Uncharacterized protein n=1 Tax=Auriscalpium vulgare TaxID=40419 RepID=A0ACB8RIU1_9AGAM|nr:hypothetical protein FA95DRAFT_1497982 [Auriscalpium vulgare]
MRMHYYLKSWGLNIAKHNAFIHKTIQQVIRYTYAILRSKSTNKVATTHQAQCNVQKPAVLWLGSKAFHTVLSHKPTAYKSLLKSLAFELSLGRNRRYKKEFGQLVKQSMSMLTDLYF